jgi:hypothetical protein
VVRDEDQSLSSFQETTGDGVGDPAKKVAAGSMLTLSSDVTPAAAAYDDIDDESAPEEIAVVIASLTLPSTSSSSY